MGWTIAEERIRGRAGYRADVARHNVTVSAWAPVVGDAIDMAGEAAAVRVGRGDDDHPTYTDPAVVESSQRRAVVAENIATMRAHAAAFRRLLERDPSGPLAPQIRAALDALASELTGAGREMDRYDREGR